MNNKEGLRDLLYTNVKKGNWEEVIKKCGEDIEGLGMMLTQPMNTTLHLAAYDNNVEVVERLVRMISMFERKDILKIKNERGNTPLHVAATMGCARMCRIIGSMDEKLVDERNKDGETPLFLAALHDHKNAFYCLYDFCKMDLVRFDKNCRRTNGDTILHCALKNDQFDLAFQLIHKNNEAAAWVDKEGQTPLHVLATKPSVFESGAHMSRWHYIVYYCISVDELKPESGATEAKKTTKLMRAASFFPENYATCIDFVTILWDKLLIIISWKRATKRKEEMNPCNYNETKGLDLEVDVDKETESMEIHQLDLPSDSQLLKRPGGHPLGFDQIRELKEEKKKHIWSVQVMEKLLILSPPDKYGQNGDSPKISSLQKDETVPYLVQGPFVRFNNDQITNETKLEDKVKVIAKETPILLAAKNGVVEMVSRIFEHCPLAIRDSNQEKKNVVLLAAEYRQPHVYKFLLRKKSDLEILFRAVDENGDSAVHLAAHLKTDNPWHITGPALQMQWEVKWYKYVRDSVEPNFFVKHNYKGVLARNIFYATHEELAKKGAEWLVKTADSCSVVAGLVVTVAYTSATSVPGGNGNDGTSPFEKETGFLIFSIASLVAFCLSSTSVIMFLGILTSRFDEKGFGSKLPGRLFVGLSSLFFSIVAMLVSFCAGHYFLLSHRLQNAAVVIYIATSLPVALFFVKSQLPLFYDMLVAILSKTPERRSDDPIPPEKVKNSEKVKGDEKNQSPKREQGL
ncbi:serine/threonine-protein phosphatase 6 regulatory ankyrin repeat subunit B-like [Cucumis melo var. makuwa]|uniref:Serine/threonine-protein phosphatase 6 regulatory ankyrin repeat subunit B-like n=2 Tax=Cucumis melo TaxID=3656 RepID=A0A5D3B854_CUCMM|nr:serine/threonine-protein phosphatase 6 regulatory ankyrin repeat subunit B-like [Cucumis melo var. makuwa]